MHPGVPAHCTPPAPNWHGPRGPPLVPLLRSPCSPYRPNGCHVHGVVPIHSPCQLWLSHFPLLWPSHLHLLCPATHPKHFEVSAKVAATIPKLRMTAMKDVAFAIPPIPNTTLGVSAPTPIARAFPMLVAAPTDSLLHLGWLVPAAIVCDWLRGPSCHLALVGPCRLRSAVLGGTH